jgi:hypothetical protein
MSDLQITKINVNDIYYDVHNPRSKYDSPFEMSEDIFDEEIQKQLIPNLLGNPDGGVGYSVNSLKESIKTAGTIVTPIWVKKVNDRFVCIEGNTRLYIYKNLLVEDEADKRARWEKIPAIVYENLDPEQEHKLKLTAHIVGTREWKPYNKAKYISELLTGGSLTWDEIANIVGGRKTELQKLVQAQINYDEFFIPIRQEKTQKLFSHYVEKEKYSPVEDRMREYGFTEEDFAKWVADEKFGMAINVRKLPKVLQNDKAREIFLAQDIREAEKYINIESTVDLSKVKLDALIAELTERLSRMDSESLDDNSALTKQIVQLQQYINGILEDIDTDE